MENDQKFLISGKPVNFPPPGWLEKKTHFVWRWPPHQATRPAWARQEGGHRSLFIVHILEISPFSECLNWLGQNILVDLWRADRAVRARPVSCECKKLNYSGCHDIIIPATLSLHHHYRYHWTQSVLVRPDTFSLCLISSYYQSDLICV